MVREEKPAQIREWTTFRPLIIGRFGVTRSPAQKVLMVSRLQQNQGENVESFYDRVAGAYYEVIKDTMEALTDPDKAAKQLGFKTARDELLKLTFVAGLRTGIREQVEAGLEATSTLSSIKEKASAVEVALSRKQSNYAAAASAMGIPASSVSGPLGSMGAELQNLIRAEVAALTKANSGSRSASSAAAPTAAAAPSLPDPNKPKPATTTPATIRMGPMGDRGWIYCHRCCQWGLHIRPECTWSVNQIKALSRADPKVKPSGTPTDRQYPNA